MLNSLPTKYWMLLSLSIWGGAVLWFGLIRFDAYGIDEGAAMALLLNWSIADQIVNPIITFGGPDFRALLFIPLGLYWSGSILAAKIFTLLITFSAAMILFSWCRDRTSHESALIATGLFLILPVTLLELDTIAIGPFALLLFGLGKILDQKYRASAHTIGSLYFIQMLLIAITVTLHPMGLGYPIALVWQWYKDPKTLKQQKQVWLGIGLTMAIVLAMQTGWITVAWFSNPVEILGQAFAVQTPLDLPTSYWITGLPLLLIAVFIIVIEIKNNTHDLLLNCLIISFIIGLFAADLSWALIAFCIILFRGIPFMININNKIKNNSFIAKRGIVLFLLFVLATYFMQGDKVYANYIASGILPPKDELIHTLALEASNKDADFLAASQWPARTMLVCRRDVLRLPTQAVDESLLVESFNKLTHIVFDHNDPKYSFLSKQLAKLTHLTETLVILPSGVIIKIRHPDVSSLAKDNAERTHSK